MIQTDRNQMAVEATPSTDGRIHLGGMIWRRKMVIALAVLLALGLGYWYYVEAPKEYQSTSLILIKERQASGFGSKEIQLARTDKMDTQIQVLASSTVLSRAMQDEALTKLSKEVGINENIGSLASGLSAAVLKSTDTLTVNFRSKNARFSTEALRAIVTAYQEALKESYLDIGEETSKLISRANENLESQILTKRQQYAEFRKKHGADLMITEGALQNFHSKQLAELILRESELAAKKASLDAEIRIADRWEAEKQFDPATVLDVISRLNELAHTDLLSSREISAKSRQDWDPSDLQQLTDLLLSEKSMGSRFGEDHPIVQDIRDKIKLLTEIHAKKGRRTDPSRRKGVRERTVAKAIV
jgi:capsular polysaccharide biosynthesis protein